MSRSATVSTSKNPPQLPSKSAWVRGPPQNGATTTPSRSQSPTPPTPVSVTNPTSFHATNSRRSSALGQGVSIKDGVNIPRSAVKQGSAVTFGSIDDASTPISSLPAYDAAHRQIEEQELRKVEEHQLKGEAEHTEKERKETEEWKESEEWITKEITECMEAEERTTWEEGACKEVDERATREALEAEERKKEHLRLEEEHSQREVEETIKWEQEWLRKVREEEAVRAAEDAGATSTLADATSDTKLDPPEEVEVEDANKEQQTDTVEETLGKAASVPPPVPISTDLPKKFLEEPFRIGTSLPSPEVSRNHPGSRDLQTTLTGSSAATFPSALATARRIEDINHITYPEGIKRPKVELNVNVQKGKFRYDRDFLLQFMNICKEKPDNLPPLDMFGKRPGLRNFQANITRNSASASPSALSTVRHIEDIDRVSYSEGIKNSEAEFGVNTWRGKFSAGTASIVPIESSLSDPNVKSPFTPNAWRARHTGSGAKPASFLGMGSGERKTTDGPCQQSENSFLQHGKYFFKDGNVTFLINGILYCVHRYLFSLESSHFSSRFTQLGARDHEALSDIVSLGDVECEDFEAFLAVLYPHLEEHELSYKQWRSVLHLSTHWGFASRRKLALKSIKPPTPYDWLLLARKYAVDHWVIPALTALCERAEPLSLDEARGMNLEDVVLVATIREDIFRFGVSGAEIPRRVGAMQARVSVRAAGDVSQTGSMREVTEQRPGSTIAPDLEAQNCDATLTEPVNGKTMSSWDLAGATAKSRDHIEPLDGEKYWRNTKVASNDEWDVLPFERGKGKMQTDEGQSYQTTNVASNDKWATAKAEAAEEAEAATAKAELEAKQKAEKKRLKIEAKSKAKAAKAEEERKRLEMEKAEICVKQVEKQITVEAASVAANASASSRMSPAWGGSNWFSKIATPLAPSATVPTEEPTHPTTSCTAAPSSGSVVSSSTLAWQGGKLTNDKQDGKAGDSEDNHTDSAPAEIVAASWPNGDLGSASTLPLPPVMPCQPRSLPESQLLRTPRQLKPEQYATVTTSPEMVASACARRETPNVADTKNTGEPPAQTKPSPAAAQHSGVKPDRDATGPTLWPSQHDEADGWGSAITKGGDINPEGPMEITPHLDDIRGVNSAFAMPASGSGAPTSDAPSFSLWEDGSDASGTKLSKAQKKKMKDRAKKLAQRVGQTVQDREEEANSPQPTISPSTPPPTVVPVAAPNSGPTPHILSTTVSSDAHFLASNYSNVPDQPSSNELIAPTEAAWQVVSTSDSGASQPPTGPLIGRVLRGAEMREVAEELGRRGDFVCRFVSRGVMCGAPPKYLRWTPEGRRLREAETYTLCCVEHGNSLPRDRRYVQIPQSLSIAHSR